MAQTQHRFADKVVIITGGATGIGLATARAFAREGARLVLAGRNLAKLQQAADGLKTLASTPVLTVACDVSQRVQVDNLMAQTIAHFGRIDILVNNAATGLIGPIEAVELSDAEALFDVNFFGTFNCCQSVLTHFKRQRSGQIINVSSVAGLRGVPNAIYSASKAAIISLSETLRLETAPFNIGVTIICPGRVRATDTAFFDTAKRYGTAKLATSPSELSADEVATVLVNATYKRQRLVVFPFHAWLLHTINKLSPALADRILQKYVPKPATN